MNIVILRHGEAESHATRDADRNLTLNGREQVRKAAECLQTLGVSFEQAWVSPFRRTQQTAEEVSSIINGFSRHTHKILVPESNPDTVVDAIEKSSLNSLLIVSHQPLVSALVGLLVDAESRLGPPMSPASMVCVNGDVVMPGCCTQVWLRHAPHYDFSE
jgi:phosphohistidine phosphatase